MKNTILLFATLLFLMGIAVETASAQRTSRTTTEDYFDDKPSFKQRLWYGGGFNVGFAGGNFNGNGATSSFILGVSPMVGYKVTDWFSIGPRVEANWVTQRFQLARDVVGKFNTVDFAVGPFARIKPLPNFFGQAEFQYVNVGVPVGVKPNNRTINERQSGERFYVGAGYSSGGVVSTEIMILYDVLDQRNTTDLPIDFRFGFTWNF